MSALKYTTTSSSDIQPLRILHLISLRQVGGIERLYTEFINFRYPDQPLEHHTLLAKRNIATMLKKICKRVLPLFIILTTIDN